MAEKEYIKREAAIRAILRQPPEPHYPGWYCRDIKEIPAADVVEVVHAEWKCDSDDDQYDGEYYCSACNAEEYVPDNAIFPPFCWHCGAKMDGATENSVCGERKKGIK